MEGLEAAAEKMRDAGVGDAAIQAFREHYERLRGGDLGVLPESELEPVADVPELDELPSDPDVAETLDRAVVVKLNGGLGTSMGLSGP
jgi:UTP--glucose-1-phosphate uridylyltransferase